MGYAACSDKSCDCYGFVEQSGNWKCYKCSHDFEAHNGPKEQKGDGGHRLCRIYGCDCGAFVEKSSNWLCYKCGHAFSVHSKEDQQKYGKGDKEPESCFPGEALILTPSGWSEIRSLKRGDWVLSYDCFSQGLLPRRVTRLLSYPPAPLLKIVTDKAQLSFRGTPSHTVLTCRGWVSIRELGIGDQLIVPEGSVATVTGINRNSGVEPVYNLYTTWQHNFIVHGVVAHNFTHFRSVRMALHCLLLDWWIMDDCGMSGQCNAPNQAGLFTPR